MVSKLNTVKLVSVTGLLGMILAAYSADASSKLDVPINDARILVACPSQTDIFAGMSQDIDWAGLTDRDLLLFEVTDIHVSVVYYSDWDIQRQPVPQNGHNIILEMSDCGLRDRYVLIGKDGGVKRRWTGQLSMDELFQTIDAMPMRRFEMKTRDAN